MCVCVGGNVRGWTEEFLQQVFLLNVSLTLQSGEGSEGCSVNSFMAVRLQVQIVRSSCFEMWGCHDPHGQLGGKLLAEVEGKPGTATTLLAMQRCHLQCTNKMAPLLRQQQVMWAKNQW